MKRQEIKAKSLVMEADKRATRDSQRQAQAQREVRVFAQELIRCRKMSARLITSKAQLSSVQMQVNEAFMTRKIEGSIRVSVGIMRHVNSLIRVPELAGTMQELSKELMKAGIIEEMVGENLSDDSLAELRGRLPRKMSIKCYRKFLETVRVILLGSCPSPSPLLAPSLRPPRRKRSRGSLRKIPR